jgi:peptidyl-prolyl cis-trans isomerase C
MRLIAGLRPALRKRHFSGKTTCKGWRGRTSGEIGGGPFIVNLQLFHHADVKGARQSAIAKPPLVGEKSAAALKPALKDRSMLPPISAGHPLRAGTLAAAMLIAAAISLSAQPARADDPLLAKVNGVEIHQSDLTSVEEEAGQIPPMSADAKRDYLVAFLTDMILVSKAADDQKLADTPEFKRKAEFNHKKQLMAALLDKTGKAALTDDAMRKVYDDAVKQMTPEAEVHARHILIRAPADDEKASKAAEDKIKAVIVRLKKGEDFGKVAAEVTEDPSGKANGGDLGFFAKDQMVPEFADTAFKLEKGQISEPVKTQFGWHVIKVEDKRTKPLPSFEEVKPQIEAYVTRKAQADLVTKLREGAKIEKFYKSEAPTDAAAPAAPATPDKK